MERAKMLRSEEIIVIAKIADAIKKAYELGKSWGDLDIEEIEENDIDSKLYH